MKNIKYFKDNNHDNVVWLRREDGMEKCCGFPDEYDNLWPNWYKPAETEKPLEEFCKEITEKEAFMLLL